MSEKRYWLIVFTGTTWQEFVSSGANVCGLSDRYQKMAERTKLGDYLLCYVAGISRFIGLLEITSGPFRDRTGIWTFDIYPLRLKVRPVILLTPESAVPVQSLKDHLSIFQNLKSPSSWAMQFRNSIREWKATDAEIVISALNEASRNPTIRPVKASKLAKEPQ